MRIPDCIRRWLLKRALHIASSRPADFVIGVNYLARWWVFPRNRWFNIYLHHITRDDDDRALHDHPWINASIILAGRYDEHLPDRIVRRYPGQVVLRLPTATHRLALVQEPVWSLFIRGPKVRTWGFHCPQGWRPWWEFADPDNPGKPGRGCD